VTDDIETSDSTKAADSDAQAQSEQPTPAQHDAERRAFFFQFGKQAVTTVGQVAGMANVVSRTSSTAAASLLGLDEAKPAPAARSGAVVRSARGGGSAVISPSTAPAAADDAYRSAYRLVDDELILLDQRRVPESIEEVTAKRGSDVAYYMRIGVLRGGPVMAQAAAYGLALTARERVDQPQSAREVELRRTRRALAAARPSSRLPAWAMERMEEIEQAAGEGDDGEAVAAALRAEADAIAMNFQVDHAALASHLADALPRPEGRPLTVLLHGEGGALAGGMVGTNLTALRQLAESGRELKIFLTEGRPFMDGARLASWELRQADLPHKVIPDAAAAWLMTREPIDAVLLDAEWGAANGDISAVIGSRAIAQLTRAVPLTGDAQRPLVIVSGVAAVIDPATADAAEIPAELRPARDLAMYLSDVPIRADDAVVPATDVIPADAIDLFVSEGGATGPVAAGS
jgi:methylthioribose-1-phosphate isomerase